MFYPGEMGTGKKKDFLLQDLLKRMGGYAVKYPSLQFGAVEAAKRSAGLPILLGNIARPLKDVFIQVSANKLREVSEFLDCLEAADHASLVEVF
ncbi:hypothetical protein OIU74_021170 [Salix koriyanagi]|uniref:Uncharacterized protein n=1 Tax=Salix koriyanagi TaxID=2511006 RepID=A0A9Q0P7J0_9ROSI|nr:hypothetical protein OIU74_021170 [Salix koriyanagi]